MKGLQDKVAVVTGGSSGIGQAIAIRLGEEGVDVVVGAVEDGVDVVVAGQPRIAQAARTVRLEDQRALVAQPGSAGAKGVYGKRLPAGAGAVKLS